MTAAQRERLKPLFEEAIGLPADERAQFLIRVRAEDAEIAAQLDSMVEKAGATVTVGQPMRDFLPAGKHFFADGELIIGRFRIVRFLGRGGMGEVYQAQDLQLGEVALKTLRPGVALESDSLLRFRQEVQLARRVTSTNVCRIHDLFQVPGDRDRLPCSFLTMELLPGVTLAECIERDGPPPFAQAESIALQLCAALQAIHDAGVVHRDFKSRNIMLTPRNGEQHAVVMDLGLARDAKPSDVGDSGITMTGAVMGTPEYMAPEQFQGPAVTHAADIYALGIVLYELATGIRPFQSTTPLGAAVMRAKHPAPVSSVRAGVPKHWDAVINRCLEYEPEKRWTSAREAAEALKGTAADRKSPKLRTWRILSGVGIAAITAALIAGGAFWSSTRSATLSRPERQQLVVLPFDNVGGDPANQALCDGLMEILTSATSETSALQKSFLVIPASEVRHDKIRSIQEARKAFNINLALTGSVMRSGDSLQVTISLSDANAMRQLASRIIRSHGNDANGLQTTLLSAVFELLQLKMQQEATRVISAGTHNSVAFDLYVEGQGYLRRFDGPPSVEKATSILQKAVKLDPSYALARSALAEAYFDKFDQTKDPQWLARADEESHRAADLNSRLPQVHATSGLIMRGTGRYEQAAAEFRIAIKLDPADFESQRLLAKTLEDSGHADEAESVYLAAIRAKPSYWPTDRSLGVFYLRRGEYTKAEPLLKMVTELVPENATGFLNLGILYYSTRRHSEAEAALRKSIALQPLATAYTDLGTLQFFQQRFSESLVSFERAAQLGPNDPYNWGNLGDSYEQTPSRRSESGQAYRKAIQLARQQLAINPNGAGLRGSLALYLAKTGDKKESLIEISRALTLGSANVDLAVNAAQVYEIAGNHTQAVSHLQEALDRGYPVDQAQHLPEFAGLKADAPVQQLLSHYASRNQKN